jgi:hypothetical protein
MVRHASLFSQLVALYNRNQFSHLVYKHKAERFSVGLKGGRRDFGELMNLGHLNNASTN